MIYGFTCASYISDFLLFRTDALVSPYGWRQCSRVAWAPVLFASLSRSETNGIPYTFALSTGFGK